MNRLAVVILGLVALIVGCVLGWVGHQWIFGSTEAKEEAAAEVKPEDMMVTVGMARIKAGSMPIVLPSAGLVKATLEGVVTISTPAAGIVTEVLINPGTPVTKGQVVLKLDDRTYRSALQQARATALQAANALAEFDKTGKTTRELELRTAVAKAQAALDLAKVKLQTQEQARTQGLISERALDDARSAVTQAQSDLALTQDAAEAYRSTGGEMQRASLASAKEVADLAVKDAELTLGQVVVPASLDGQLLSLTVRVGDHVEAGAPLGAILVPHGRVLSFGVAIARASEVHIGAPATWTVDGEHWATGKVRALPQQVDPVTGLQEVLVTPDDDADVPAQGMIVRGEIELSRKDDIFIVSEEALLHDPDEPDVNYVMIVDDKNIAHKKEAEVVTEHRGQVALEFGGVEKEGEIVVKDGDRVVTGGNYNLPDGARVIEEGAATQPAATAPAGGAKGAP